MPKFSSDDVEIQSQETLFQGFFKMRKWRFRHKLFAGGWSDPIEREVFERGHAVAVLPYDPIREEFVLIEQIRIPAHETSTSPWLIEIIAGIIEPGEAPDEVCRREAQEEAALEVQHLSKALSYLVSPGGTTERVDIYMACVDAGSAGGIHGLEQENEDILVHRISEQQAMQWLNDGTIDNSAAIIALQWFALNKSRLLSQWGNIK